MRGCKTQTAWRGCFPVCSEAGDPRGPGEKLEKAGKEANYGNLAETSTNQLFSKEDVK